MSSPREPNDVRSRAAPARHDEAAASRGQAGRTTAAPLLADVWRDLGFTAVLVTHDVGEAVHLADRVIVLEEGRIKLDLAVPFPHPRRHGNVDLAEIEGRLLASILGD